MDLAGTHNHIWEIALSNYQSQNKQGGVYLRTNVKVEALNKVYLCEEKGFSAF